MNPEVDFFFNKPGRWQEAFRLLRTLVLNCHLAEELKWGCPCYTFRGKNIVLIHGFKEYCALLFHKGALLRDTEGILVRQTEHVQSARQVRFTGPDEIRRLQPVLEAYIMEAVAAEEQGLKVPLRKTSDFAVPEEFQSRLDADPDLKAAFEALTPGRQRGYLFYFGQARQSGTRASRVEKHIPRILEGKGLDD